MIWIIVGTTGITLLVLLIVGCVEKARETDYEDKAKELDGQYGKLTKEIEFGLLDIDKTIRIYADSNKIWMMGKTFDFKDIRSVSLETETRTGSQKIMATSSTDTLGTIGRSVAGAVVGGSTGALIGAGTAKHKTVIEKEGGYNTTSYIVDVKTNILNTPVVTVRFESDRDKALELYSTLELIIEQTHKESEQ